MKTSNLMKSMLAMAGCVAAGAVAYAAVTFDAETGKGFVGKGDVQDAFGWNNAALQANAGSVHFRANQETVTTWDCYKAPNANGNGGNTQHHSKTVTTGRMIATVLRDNKKGQVTGFSLDGFEVGGGTQNSGDAYLKCPNSNSGYVLVEDSIEETTTGGSGLEVSIDGENWFVMQ